MAFLKSARLLHQDFLGFSFQCTFLSETKRPGKVTSGQRHAHLDSILFIQIWLNHLSINGVLSRNRIFEWSWLYIIYRNLHKSRFSIGDFIHHRNLWPRLWVQVCLGLRQLGLPREQLLLSARQLGLVAPGVLKGSTLVRHGDFT